MANWGKKNNPPGIAAVELQHPFNQDVKQEVPLPLSLSLQISSLPASQIKNAGSPSWLQELIWFCLFYYMAKPDNLASMLPSSGAIPTNAFQLSRSKGAHRKQLNVNKEVSCRERPTPSNQCFFFWNFLRWGFVSAAIVLSPRREKDISLLGAQCEKLHTSEWAVQWISRQDITSVFLFEQAAAMKNYFKKKRILWIYFKSGKIL